MTIFVNPFTLLRRKWDCFRRGEHLYVYDSPSMGGDWIRCSHCRHLDEWIPGVHEPKGYTIDDFLQPGKHTRDIR